MVIHVLSLNLTGKEIYSIEYDIYDNQKQAIIKVISPPNSNFIKIVFLNFSLIMEKHFQ